MKNVQQAEGNSVLAECIHAIEWSQIFVRSLKLRVYRLWAYENHFLEI